MSATVDLSQFRRSLDLMRQVPRKHGPDVLNKAVLTVAVGSSSGFGLVQLTQKATKSRIERDLKRNKLGLKLAVRSLKKKGAKITNAAVSAEYERIRKARVQSRAYIAAGWLHAARDLARKVPSHSLSRLRDGKNMPVRDDASAAQSFARAATSGSLTAGLFNTSRGAGSVCPDEVVQVAVNYTVKDMQIYLERKFGAAMTDATQGTDTARRVA